MDQKGNIDQSYPQNPHELPPPYYPELPKHDNQGGQGPPIGFAEPSQPVSPQVVQIVQVMNLGSRSTRMHCPHCGADVETRVRFNPGRMTHIAAIILCLLCWPCVCVPYCIDECQDAEHDCPNCDRHIGTYRR